MLLSQTHIESTITKRRGPFLPEVLEHLAGRGVRQIMGFGYVHSLTTHIMDGQIVLASCGIDLDEDRPIIAYPNRDLFEAFRNQAARRCLSIRRARILTADLQDEDFEDRIQLHRQLDAEVVHPDMFNFLSEARRFGLSAVFAGVTYNTCYQSTKATRLNPVAREMVELEELLSSTLGLTTSHEHRLESKTMTLLFK